MSEATVLYQKVDRVALIAFNRPQAMNASTYQLRTELTAAFEAAEQDDEVRVVVLTGEGRAFSAGADLREPFTDQRATVEEHLHEDHKPLINFIRHSKKCYIAAINGAAAGISVGYALACDMVAIAESAYIYSPFAAISLIPDGCVTWQLAHYLGRARAYEMIIGNGRLTATEANEAGLVNRVFADDDFRAQALSWAGEVAENSAPLSLRFAKEALWKAADSSWEETFNKEAELQNFCVNTVDNIEGATAFLEKRKPVFVGK
ncbi:MAG: enoyl-CoA hydratase/isomerase family protein [Pseudomonadota bacterium]